MKIFLSFLQSEIQHPIPAYSFWQYYIKKGIAEAGHTWDEAPGLDWAFGIVPKSIEEQNSWKGKVWEQTVNYLEENPADVFLSYLYPAQIDSGAINRIKSLGIACVNFFCDNVREFKKIPAEFSVFDLNWVPEQKAIDLYKSAGYNYINLPMPIWLEPKLRVPQGEANSLLTFIGSKDIQRQLFFENVMLKRPDLPLAIHGKGWGEGAAEPVLAARHYSLGNKLAFQFNFIKENGTLPYLRKLKQRKLSAEISPVLKAKVGGPISFEEYNQLTSASMITVGVNRYPSYNFPLNQPNTYSRLRDIEAPMLGACYLTEYTEGLGDLYDFDNEIAVYTDASSFIAKVDVLQKDKKLRKKLKVNGQKRALHDHSIAQSLNKIIQKIR
ncbi:glycosyltransferase [Mucilaginibacter sp.]|uniref:glycosyltransferase family protein n=1 Tax=Mucilaginibacter sp. TaxID=1882438 RepID=UPI0025CF188C|nr:glycosyltransferase [Mucilaginibacter sp.]